jgi:hypothetical protein
MGESFPRISDPQVTARDAEKIFEGLLSSRLWNDTKIPQERDFGLDYRIEAIQDGSLKGCEFLVQLKGFETIEHPSVIPISVPTTTLRYWKNKILPVLIVAIDCSERSGCFAWFDKSIDVQAGQKTQTIHVPRDHLLVDYKLMKSLEPYYGDWTTQFQDARKQQFYSRLFHDSLVMLECMVQTLGSLLYAPNLPAEQLGTYRDHRLDPFLMIFTAFLHDVNLYAAGMDLSSNPIDEHLDRLLKQANMIHERFSAKVGELPGWGVSLINFDRAYSSLPSLSFLFSEISQFFRGRFLTRATERPDQTG